MDRIKSNLVPFHLCLWEMGHAGVYCLVIGQLLFTGFVSSNLICLALGVGIPN